MDDILTSPYGALALAIILYVGVGFFAFLFPLQRIFKRAGLNKAWLAALVLPFLGHAIVFGYMAFKTWPHQPEGYY